MRHDDDVMDDLHRQLFTLLMDREWKHGVAAAVDITLLGRYYERFADHAVEIGRRVIFQATGTSERQLAYRPAAPRVVDERRRVSLDRRPPTTNQPAGFAARLAAGVATALAAGVAGRLFSVPIVLRTILATNSFVVVTSCS